MVHVNKPLVLGALSAVAVAALVFALLRSDKAAVSACLTVGGWEGGKDEVSFPPPLPSRRFGGGEHAD